MGVTQKKRGGSPSGGVTQRPFATAGGGAGGLAVAEKLDDVVVVVATQKN